MRDHLLLILLLLVPALVFAQNSTAAPRNVAVMDLEPRGVSKFEAVSLSDRLRSEILSTGKFKVMERNQMDVILKEQGFQQTGACSEASCIVEVGQLIAVEQMVAGSVGKVGSIYTVEIKVLNVGTGQIMQTVSEDCDCPIEELLMKTMKWVARRLAGLEVEEKAPAVALEKGNAGLFVKSDPPGARVYLDGKLQQGRQTAEAPLPDHSPGHSTR